MVNALTYDAVVADILRVSATGDEEPTQAEVRAMCEAFREFLVQFTIRTNGYMLLAAMLVSFNEMKVVASAAQGKDKALIEDLMKAVIGSFGSSVQ